MDILNNSFYLGIIITVVVIPAVNMVIRRLKRWLHWNIKPLNKKMKNFIFRWALKRHQHYAKIENEIGSYRQKARIVFLSGLFKSLAYFVA